MLIFLPTSILAAPTGAMFTICSDASIWNGSSVGIPSAACKLYNKETLKKLQFKSNKIKIYFAL